MHSAQYLVCCRPAPPPAVPAPAHEDPAAAEPGGRRLGLCELPMPPMMDAEPEQSYTPDSDSRRPPDPAAGGGGGAGRFLPSPDPNQEVPARIQR